MSASTGTTSSASVYTTPAFWERLWRTAGIQSFLCFYDGDRMRILIAAVFYGLAVLNLMWFAGALRTTLADAAQDGWGAAATASSAALGALFLLLISVVAAFGLWRARLISNAFFAGGVAAVVLVLLGGTTWLSGGFWAPDGVYSRFVSPAVGLVWGMVVSGVLLTRSPATRAGW